MTSQQIDPSQIIPYEIEKDLFDIRSFSCGRKAYDQYLAKDAFIDHETKIGRVWIFTHRKKVVGYVTLAMSQVEKYKHNKLGKMTHHGAVPGLLLGQMARHTDYKKSGIGKIMIGWVIKEAIEFSKRVGCRLIILHSEKDKVEMYKEWGFIHIPPSKGKNQDMMFFDLSWYS